MRRISRIVYLIASWLFTLGVIVQVFLAGMVVVAGQSSWENHIGLGHSLGLPLLIMLLTVFIGGMPRRTKWLTLLLFVVYVLQSDVIIFLRQSAPLVSALHPVLALADFALGLTLALQAWPLVIRGKREPRVSPVA